jgi:hypothetical protein
MADEKKSKAGWLIALVLAVGAIFLLKQPVQASNDKIVIQAVTWI